MADSDVELIASLRATAKIDTWDTSPNPMLDRAAAAIERLRSERDSWRRVAERLETEKQALPEFIWAGEWDQPEMPSDMAGRTALYAWGYSQSATLSALIEALRARARAAQ